MGDETAEQKAKAKKDSNADRKIKMPRINMPSIRSLKRGI